MKALLCKNFGEPDTLVLADIPSLKPSPGNIVIRVAACSINFPDILMIRNKYQFKPPLPFSPGGEVSGIVKAVGSGVSEFNVGDRVIALCGWGGLAEEVEVRQERVFALIPEMDFIDGASVMYNYGTAYHALKDRANLKKGETILVLGASGGVGLAAVELSTIMGATVIAAASDDKKLQVCTEKGANFTINYNTQDLKNAIKVITQEKGVDVVYDPIGGAATETALRTLSWRGRYLVVGFAAGEIPKIPLNLPLLKGSAIIGIFWGRFSELEPQNNRKNIKDLTEMLKSGQIKPHIYKVYNLNNATDALKDMIDRKVTGKAVILINENL